MKDPLNIVIVDDSAICTTVTQMAIFNATETATRVVNYVDADDFIANMTEHSKIDLLVVDYQMPRMNGIELIKMIKDSKNIKKIIMLTGFSSMDKLNVPDGVDIYYKPVSPHQIRKMLFDA